MSAIIDVRGVRKTYGHVDALNGIDLTVLPGQVVALLGPNGAGKSTLVSLILGLRRPSTGTVRLLGWDPGDRRARCLRGAMLQECGLPGMLTVRELISLFCSYYPAPLAVDDVLQIAGLSEKAGAQIAGLSGGEKQRVSFALAVCGDPELLVLDEPTVALDVEGRRDFWSYLRRCVQAGKTIVLTTHYLEEVDAIADRVVVIHRGRIVDDADPACIRARVPATRVTFRCRSALDRRLLDDLPARAVEVVGSRVLILTNEPDAALRTVFERGLETEDLRVEGAQLEEAFLAITGKQSAEKVAAVGG